MGRGGDCLSGGNSVTTGLVRVWAQKMRGAFAKATRLGLSLLVSLSLTGWSFTGASAASNPRYAAIVIDGETGKVLFARNADKARYPASLTKIMTLYLTFEALEKGKVKLDTRMKVSKRAAGQAPSKLWLKTGDVITVEHAILALVTKSANDAATVLSEQMGGTEYNFSLLMTKKARELGMHRTRFMNASGLPNRKQKSTARDMAILAKAIQEHFPTYYRYFSTKKFTYKGRTYKTHNKLLAGYKGTDGIKTGYTRASGFNLTTSVKRNGQHLIGVVLGGKSGNSRDQHMKYILNKSFARITNDPTVLPRMAVVPTPRHKPTVINPGEALLASTGTKPDGTYDVAALDLPGAGGDGMALTFTPPEAEQGDRVPGSVQPGWGIQIGAYQAADAARLFLIKAIETEPGLLSRTTSAIMPLELGRSTLYRARFGPMSYDKAREACSALKAKAFSCFEVNERNWPEAIEPENAG